MSISKVPSLHDFMDCSALSEKGRCARLTLRICQGEGCNFRQSKEEDNESLKNAYKRLSSLSSSMQVYIAKRYYGGLMPWFEAKNIKIYKAYKQVFFQKTKKIQHQI
jgi:hypothetical protein